MWMLLSRLGTKLPLPNMQITSHSELDWSDLAPLPPPSSRRNGLCLTPLPTGEPVISLVITGLSRVGPVWARRDDRLSLGDRRITCDSRHHGPSRAGRHVSQAAGIAAPTPPPPSPEFGETRCAADVRLCPVVGRRMYSALGGIGGLTGRRGTAAGTEWHRPVTHVTGLLSIGLCAVPLSAEYFSPLLKLCAVSVFNPVSVPLFCDYVACHLNAPPQVPALDPLYWPPYDRPFGADLAV